jgi:MFS family permease
VTQLNTRAKQLKDTLQPTVFDGWRSITISLYMTLVGYAVLVGVPVISTAWVELLGFTEEQVGRVAGADLGGLSLGAVVASLLVARMNRRVLVLISVAIVIASNGLCMVFVDYETVLWLRVGAGLGSGIYTAVAVATLGGSSNPARAFNLMLFAFAFSQALEMQVLACLFFTGCRPVRGFRQNQLRQRNPAFRGFRITFPGWCWQPFFSPTSTSDLTGPI